MRLHDYMSDGGYNTVCSPVKWAYYTQDLIGDWTFSIMSYLLENTFREGKNYPADLTPNDFFPFDLKGTTNGEWETIPNSVFKQLVKEADERKTASDDGIGSATKRFPKNRLSLKMPYSVTDSDLDFNPLETCFPRSVWFFLVGTRATFGCYMVVGNPEDGPLRVTRIGRETRVELTPLRGLDSMYRDSDPDSSWGGRFVLQSGFNNNPSDFGWESFLDRVVDSMKHLKNPHWISTTKGEALKWGGLSFEKMAAEAAERVSGTGIEGRKMWIWKPSKYARLSPNRGLLNWSESLTG